MVLRQTGTVGTVGTVGTSGTSGTIGESVETAHAWFHLVRRDNVLTWTLGREPRALQGIDKLFPTLNFLMGIHGPDGFPPEISTRAAMGKSGSHKCQAVPLPGISPSSFGLTGYHH